MVGRADGTELLGSVGQMTTSELSGFSPVCFQAVHPLKQTSSPVSPTTKSGNSWATYAQPLRVERPQKLGEFELMHRIPVEIFAYWCSFYTLKYLEESAYSRSVINSDRVSFLEAAWIRLNIS